MIKFIKKYFAEKIRKDKEQAAFLKKVQDDFKAWFDTSYSHDMYGYQLGTLWLPAKIVLAPNYEIHINPNHREAYVRWQEDKLDSFHQKLLYHVIKSKYENRERDVSIEKKNLAEQAMENFNK